MTDWLDEIDTRWADLAPGNDQQVGIHPTYLADVHVLRRSLRAMLDLHVPGQPSGCGCGYGRILDCPTRRAIAGQIPLLPS